MGFFTHNIAGLPAKIAEKRFLTRAAQKDIFYAPIGAGGRDDRFPAHPIIGLFPVSCGVLFYVMKFNTGK